MALRRFLFAQWDVFTDESLSGNPLAIFPDAGGLGEDQLQKLARETNLSETVFLFRRTPDVEREHGVAARIFTPEKELPFAGHPSLGAALMLSAGGHSAPIILDLKIGRVEVRVETMPGGAAFGEMRQPEPRFMATCAREDIAPHLGLSSQDIESDLPVQIVSTGLAYLIVPVRSMDCVGRIRVDWRTAIPFLESLQEKPSLYIITRETTTAEAHLHARCLDPEREDPATGSAAGCAIAWMVMHHLALPGERVVIEQGLEIQRPSRIFARASRDGTRITDVRVGGYAVEVLRGEYLLP